MSNGCVKSEDLHGNGFTDGRSHGLACNCWDVGIGQMAGCVGEGLLFLQLPFLVYFVKKIML